MCKLFDLALAGLLTVVMLGLWPPDWLTKKKDPPAQ